MIKIGFSVNSVLMVKLHAMFSPTCIRFQYQYYKIRLYLDMHQIKYVYSIYNIFKNIKINVDSYKYDNDLTLKS